MDKKHRIIKAKLNTEFNKLVKMLKNADMNRFDLIKARLFQTALVSNFDKKKVLNALNSIGTECKKRQFN